MGPRKSWCTARGVSLRHLQYLQRFENAWDLFGISLACRYLEGHGVQLDLETAAFYFACAADKAHAEFHLVGRQPIIEAQRLTAANEAIAEIGQKGEDDDAIQYQVQRG